MINTSKAARVDTLMNNNFAIKFFPDRPIHLTIAYLFDKKIDIYLKL